MRVACSKAPFSRNHPHVLPSRLAWRELRSFVACDRSEKCAGGGEAGAAEQPSEDADLELAHAIAASMGDNAAWQARLPAPPALALSCSRRVSALHACLGSGFRLLAPEPWLICLASTRRQRRSCPRTQCCAWTVQRVLGVLAPCRGHRRTEAQELW